MPETRDLGRVLQQLRRRAGLTQQEAAELAGLSVAGLRDVEQGRVATPRARTIRLLGGALGLSADEVAELVELSRPGRRRTAGVWVGVLGPLSLRVDGAEVDPGSEIQRILLGLLSLAANTKVSRETILEVTWGGDPPANVATVLPTRISRLRRRLQVPTPGAPGPSLVATGGGYQLNVPDDQLDLLTFHRLVTQARQQQAAGELAAAADRFAEAVALWRGDPLSGLAPLANHPAVTALIRMWRSVVVEYATVAMDLGRNEQIVPLLQQVVAEDPLHEPAHARLIVALASSGQQAAALTVFETVRRRLAEELGASPGPELASAHLRVLRHQVPRPQLAPVRAHRQLPPDIADFCGREAELRWLAERLPAADGGSATSVPIYTIEGMGGVGKTRLAVRAAHQLLAAGRYAEQQLYVDLHGHAEEPPADPAAVLGSFLQLLGVPGEQIPTDLAERSALYRDRLHGRPALVLLDNAASEEQVRPLLPASPTNLVLVTSRRSLALDGAHTLPLEVFTEEEATALLTRVVGADRVSTDPVAASRVVRRCGRLPLAVALVARRLQARPAWTMADLVARIADDRHRLAELAAGTRALRSVFDLSYQALSPGQQEMFRLFGVHPGKDTTAEAAAALVDVTPQEARCCLDRLVDEHLVIAAPGDRYRLHDLLRAYAYELAHQADPQAGRAAFNRLVSWYTAAAATAQQRMFPANELPPADSAPSPQPPRFDSDDAAFGWLAAEQANLTTVIDAALDHGHGESAWRLAAALRHYYLRSGDWHEWLRTAEAGLVGARQCGSRHGEALMLNDLGVAHGNLDQVAESVDMLTQAVTVSQELSDPSQEARCRNNLGISLAICGRTADSFTQLRHALALVEELGTPLLRARTLSNLGRVHTLRGEYQNAIGCFRSVLSLIDVGADPWGHAMALVALGEALHLAGQLAEAAAVLRRAVQVNYQKAAPTETAAALLLLSDVLIALDEDAEAAECRQRGETLLAGLEPTYAERIRRRVRLRPAASASSP